VAEREGEVIFLYKIERGRASKSYGIEVARLAGLPPEVLARAREVLARLEHYELDVFAEVETAGEKIHVLAPTISDAAGSGSEEALGRAATRAGRRALAAHLTLFDSVNQSLLDELRDVDVETLSVDEARQLLQGLKKRII
jgi:DNA mismatch repair protein MutS